MKHVFTKSCSYSTAEGPACFKIVELQQPPGPGRREKAGPTTYTPIKLPLGLARAMLLKSIQAWHQRCFFWRIVTLASLRLVSKRSARHLAGQVLARRVHWGIRQAADIMNAGVVFNGPSVCQRISLSSGRLPRPPGKSPEITKHITDTNTHTHTCMHACTRGRCC